MPPLDTDRKLTRAVLCKHLHISYFLKIFLKAGICDNIWHTLNFLRPMHAFMEGSKCEVRKKANYKLPYNVLKDPTEDDQSTMERGKNARKIA